MDKIFIIADDLTGAADTGVQFSPSFKDVMLSSYRLVNRALQAVRPSASRAVALYTNSRSLSADAANRRLVLLARELAGTESARIYKKIDSCMRGNVGSEADALLEELNFDVSFITPAFPEMGRTTRDDIHLVHGVPLDQTEISRDPTTPVKESRVSSIVQSQSRHPVGHVGSNFLESGQDYLGEEIERQLSKCVRHIVFDAANRDHLDLIAKLYFLSKHKILPTGSAGLAGSIAKQLASESKADKFIELNSPEGLNLLVCGTASTVTGQQIEKLSTVYSYDVFQLSPTALAGRDRTADFLKLTASIRSGLLQKNTILTIRPQQNDRNIPGRTNSRQAADSIVRGLGRLVADVAAATKPGHLFLTGGDTADAVLTAIEAESIGIVGEVVAGVVQGVINGGLLDGLPVVTKAGAFGQEDTLIAVHEYWRRR
jgi:uncharacterized protein YgbK (DUF1537 family)